MADVVTQFKASPRRHLVRGTIWVFLGEALLVPTGLLTAAFLTRKLAPEGYGLFTVAATLVTWLEWSIVAVFTRATFKLVGEAEDWRLAGAAAARVYFLAGAMMALILCLVANPIAGLLKAPALAGYLRLFAIDIPVFSLAQAHRSILVGIGRFGNRATVTAVRWSARLIFIILFVEAGLSISGAIIGSVCASLIELLFCRFFIQPPLFGRLNFPVAQLWSYALPLLLYSLSMRLLDKLDLILLQGLRGQVSEAGIYGAAQNLTILGGVFALAFTPLLQSTLTRLLRSDQPDLARRTGYDALRVVVGMLPFAAIVSASAGEIATAIFGPAFAQAGIPLSLLIYSSIGFVAISVSTAILIAAGYPGATALLTSPLVFMALAGHFWLIPHLGMRGAALVTTAVAVGGGVAAIIAVHRIWSIKMPITTIVRSIVISGAAYLLAESWAASTFPAVTLKLIVICSIVPLAFLSLGELDPTELRNIRSLLARKSAVVQ